MNWARVGAALCIMAVAVFAASMSLRAGLAPAAIKLQFPIELVFCVPAFVFGLIMFGRGSAKGVGVLVVTAVVAYGGTSIVSPFVRAKFCARGRFTQCSALARSLEAGPERDRLDARACSGGVRAACGRIARDGDPAAAQSLYDQACAAKPDDFLCANYRDITHLCDGDAKWRCDLD